MLTYLFKVSIRNLARNRFFAICTILGLSVALAASVYTLVFVLRESGVDKQLVDRDNTYRLLMNSPVFEGASISTFNDLPVKLREGFPEVRSTTFISTIGPVKTQIERETYLERHALVVDSTFLSFFDLPLIEGSKESVLYEPNSVLLSKNLAVKLFGKRDQYTGRELNVNGKLFFVAGVFFDNRDSHLNYQMLLSRASFDLPSFPSLRMGFTYVMLHPGASKSDFEKKLKAHRQDLVPFEFTRDEGFYLQPRNDWYFHMDDPVYEYSGDVFRTQSKFTINTTIAISSLLLALALCNYLIFSQARILSNSKQLVLNKIFGQKKAWMFLSFLIDALIVLTVGYLFALLLIVFFRQFMVGLSGLQMDFMDFVEIRGFSSSILFIFFVGLALASLCMLLSPEIKVSENLSTNARSSMRFRKLIPFVSGVQVSLAVCLLLVISGVMAQLKFIRNFDMGYSDQRVWDISIGELPLTALHVVRDQFENLPDVEQLTLCSGTPISGRWFYNEDAEGKEITMNEIHADENYLSLLGLRLIKGRNFDPSNYADSLSIIINETAARALRLDVDSVLGYSNVIGIVKDFKYGSLKERVGPLKICYSDFSSRSMSQEFRLLMRIRGYSGLEKVRQRWMSLYPDTYLHMVSFEEEVKNLHKSELESFSLLMALSTICVGITLFGLLGFSYFLVREKRREVAIRKVFGAQLNEVRWRLLMEVIQKYVVGLVLAVIVSWIALQEWLTGYAERVDLGILVFLIPLGIFMLILVVAVSYQIIADTKIKPADVIRI
jgi:putative ABC transport system permease protein